MRPFGLSDSQVRCISSIKLQVDILLSSRPLLSSSTACSTLVKFLTSALTYYSSLYVVTAYSWGSTSLYFNDVWVILDSSMLLSVAEINHITRMQDTSFMSFLFSIFSRLYYSAWWSSSSSTSATVPKLPHPYISGCCSWIRPWV